MVVLYKDIAKTAENVLKDDYDFSRKLKIKTKAANGVSFTTEGDMASNKAILAKLSGSFTHESSGVIFKKLQVSSPRASSSRPRSRTARSPRTRTPSAWASSAGSTSSPATR